ncbi:lipopolysaccharide heptosyltransferase family protein [Candidatus Pelagibacter ubique]|jgi:ADP-heptose:LPS heptosyltransferase|nr:lipopolysaccharide heptosyltransferase family protein [Candidatus Pelagibacter ubique]
MKILIYNSGGGLGDSIQLFDIITSLKKKFGEKNLYYLSAHENHFKKALKDYNIHLESLETNIKYFGFRLKHYFYSKNILKNTIIKKFDLIIDLQSKLRNSLILKKIPHKSFYSSTLNFKLCSVKKNYDSSKNDLKKIIFNLEKLLDVKIPFIKYNINSIDKLYFNEAKKLLPKNNYIGFSITQGNEYRKKSWSLNRFINIAKKISDNGKQPVFFIEKKNKELINDIKKKINNGIFPELASSFSGPPLITALATRLDKVISIDNGIMHMVGLANIPMIVLFGPTNSFKFAPKIKNINILDSKLIYNSDDILRIKEEDILKLV